MLVMVDGSPSAAVAASNTDGMHDLSHYALYAAVGAAQASALQAGQQVRDRIEGVPLVSAADA